MNKLYYYVDCFENFGHLQEKYNLLMLEKPRRGKAKNLTQQLWQCACVAKKKNCPEKRTIKSGKLKSSQLNFSYRGWGCF